MQINLHIPTKVRKAIQAMVRDDYHTYKQQLDSFAFDKGGKDKQKFFLHTLIYVALYARPEKYAALLKSYAEGQALFETSGYRLKPIAISHKAKSQAITDLGQHYALLSDKQIKSLRAYFTEPIVQTFLSESLSYYLAGARMGIGNAQDYSHTLRNSCETAFSFLRKNLLTDKYPQFQKLTLSHSDLVSGTDFLEKSICDIIFSNLEMKEYSRTEGLSDKDAKTLLQTQRVSSGFLAKGLHLYFRQLGEHPELFQAVLELIRWEDLLQQPAIEFSTHEQYQHFLTHCEKNQFNLSAIYHEDDAISKVRLPNYQSEEICAEFKVRVEKQRLQLSLAALQASLELTPGTTQEEAIKKTHKI